MKKKDTNEMKIDRYDDMRIIHLNLLIEMIKVLRNKLNYSFWFEELIIFIKKTNVIEYFFFCLFNKLKLSSRPPV